MGTESSKGKKGCRKAGRNKVFCTGYRNRNQREKNKLVILNKHVIRHPADLVAGSAVDHCKKMIRGY
jgi:hypothetical protein